MYLNNKIVYLAGPIHNISDNGSTWRDYITPMLKEKFNLVINDPTKMTANGLGEVGDDKQLMKNFIKNEQWEDLKKAFYPIVRKDLRCVDKADFIIVSYDPTIHTVGTIHEIVLASIIKKPILLKYDRNQLSQFNPWISCFLKPQWFFPTWDSLFEYLDKINLGDIETSHWGLE